MTTPTSRDELIALMARAMVTCTVVDEAKEESMLNQHATQHYNNYLAGKADRSVPVEAADVTRRIDGGAS
jgi:ribosomal protein L16 Arg81 hydroxylase